MSTPEEVSGSHALTTSEQLFCTLTAWHERVSVYIKGGVANVVGAQWKVYAINGSQKTLLYTGTSKTLLNELVTTGVVPGQGDTIALYGVNPFGATASVKAYMVGWDPSAAVSPVQASDVAGITLTLAEQDVCTLTGGYVNLDVAFNANGDPLAGLAQIRLYALLGGADRFQLEQFQIPTNDQGIPATGSVNLIQDYLAGATEFILTAQGRYGTSAVTVTGVLEGETGSAGAGGGGGPPVGSYWPTQTQVLASVTNPILEQAAATSDVAPQDIVVKAQSAFAGATVNTQGGNLRLRAAPGATGGGQDGNIFVETSAGATLAEFQANTGALVVPAQIETHQLTITFGGGGTDVLANTGAPAPNGTTGGSLWLANGETYNSLWVKPETGGPGTPYVAIPQQTQQGFVLLDPAFTAPGIGQDAQALDAATPDFLVKASDAFTGGGVHTTGGKLLLQSGKKVGGGVDGAVGIRLGSQTTDALTLQSNNIFQLGTTSALNLFDPTTFGAAAQSGALRGGQLNFAIPTPMVFMSLRNATNTGDIPLIQQDSGGVWEIGFLNIGEVELIGGPFIQLNANDGGFWTQEVGSIVSVLNTGVNAIQAGSGPFTWNSSDNSVTAWAFENNGVLAASFAPGAIDLEMTTATSATAGANGALPLQVALYGEIKVGATTYKVPLYNL